MGEKPKKKNSGKKSKKPEPRAEKTLFVCCPGCGELQPMQDDRFVYKCPKCQAMFEKPDDIPAHLNPTRRMEVRERRYQDAK